MPYARNARAALIVVFTLSASACVTLPANSQRVPQDPWESWNRGVYKFNDVLDRAICRIAKGYVHVVPHPIRTGVSNFFDNLQK
jgi:phospholipid-binding lipoprotein MlaA